nr:uncharacterized protein LOC109185595 [Ipomoea trifida]
MSQQLRTGVYHSNSMSQQLRTEVTAKKKFKYDVESFRGLDRSWYHRARPIIIDPGLYHSKKSGVFWAKETRSLPSSSMLFMEGNRRAVLEDAMKVAGANVLEDDIIETYGNDDEALNAVENGVAVGDLSHYGRIIEESSSTSSEMAAYVAAASVVTAVVAAGEKTKEEAARELQSPQSSPCDWFVCDDSTTHTHCFIIQDTDVLVHRGIYEVAKGIYEQFLPTIKQHLNEHGDQANFQFTGHSLGGSLSLLVNLILLTRKVVSPTCLLPVVMFAAPHVFCGGEKVLEQLEANEFSKDLKILIFTSPLLGGRFW